ncbi:hypothetical protein [Bosea sp. (in: a-proteobacteria)]|uniref:hypothetical protein n=1 Tax=Bosea sp. (in: a-proteobacteria) TaxID=1871050 RepID=UPI002FCAD05B
MRRVSLSGLGQGETVQEAQASFLAPRLLPRLFREPAQAGAEARAALGGARRLVVLLPIGRYDDGVWAPIIERILLGAGEAAAGPRETILAWSGVEPFLAPFGRRAQEIWSDPRLVEALLGVFERSARSLAAVLRELGEGAGIRRGLIRFEPGPAEAPARVALALA